MYLPAANIQVLSDLCKKNGEKFFKVSYNQGFCSLLGLRGFLKKKSQYPADGAEYCDFAFFIRVYFLVICVYSILSSIDFNT